MIQEYVYVSDIQSGKILYISNGLIDLFKLTNDSIIEKSFFLDKVNSEDREKVNSFLSDLNSGSEKYRLLINKKTIWIDHFRKIILNNDSQICFSYIKDISESKSLDEYVGKNNEHLDFFFYKNEQPMLIIDAENLNIIDANYSASKKLNVNRSNLLNIPFTGFITDSKNFLESVKSFHLNEEDSHVIYLNMITANDSVIYSELICRKLKLLSQNAFLVKIIDISESLGYIKKVNSKENMLSDYMQAVSSATILSIADPTGVIVYVNENFLNISKYSKNELIGKKHNIIKSGYHPREFFENMWKTISAGEIWRGEVKNRAKDESYYWVDTFIIPFFNEKGDIDQYLSIRSDITQRKLKEKEIETLYENLKVQNQKLREFSFINAHKVRGPLVSLMGLVDMVKDKTFDNFDEVINKLNETTIILDRTIKEMSLVLDKNIANQYIENIPKKLDKIFLVDDDKIQHMVNKVNLKKVLPECKIETFTEGLSALSKLDDDPDLILLDINMPEMDGWGVLDEMRNRSRENIDVFMLTSSCDPEDEDHAKQYKNVKGFIMKPLTKEKIKHLLLGENPNSES